MTIPDSNSQEGGKVEPHPCRFFNGKCIDCGRSHGAPRSPSQEGRSSLSVEPSDMDYGNNMEIEVLPLGYSLAMRVMQSDLYAKLDGQERAECDDLIRQGLRKEQA